MIEHALYAHAERIPPEAVYQLDQRISPGPRRSALGMEVAQHIIRGARIGLHHAENVVIFLAPFVYFHAGEDHAFLEQVFGIGAIRVLCANVIPVCLVTGVTRQLPVLHEHRHHHRGILGMGTGTIRHVVKQDITRFQRFDAAHPFYGCFDTEIHGAQEYRQCRRLGQQADIVIIQRHAKVVCLIDNGRKRSPGQGVAHLVGNGIE